MKKFLALLFCVFTLNASMLIEGEKTQFLTVNPIKNAGFEADKANWTSSGGTFAITATAANVAEGKYAASFDASDTSQYFQQASIPLSYGLRKANCVVTFKYKNGDTNLALNILDASANIISSKTLDTATDWVSVTQNFICPDSATITVKIISSANAAIAYFDNFFIGDANRVNISQISQAEVYGSKSWVATTNCSGWTKSANNWNAYPVDADCDDNARTLTGQAIADASNDGQLPNIRFASIPAGIIKVTLIGYMYNTYATTSTDCSFGFTDGTTQKTAVTVHSSSAVTEHDIGTAIVYYTYTTSQSDITFSALSNRLSGGGSCNFISTVQGFTISVERFPLTSEIAFRPEVSPSFWSGYHDSTCSWARTNTAYGDPTADSTCVLVERTNQNFGTVTSYLSGSDKLPGIVFSPPTTGTYYICSYATANQGTASQYTGIEMTDGSANIISEAILYSDTVSLYSKRINCGFYNITDITSKTIKLMIKSASGAITIQGSGGTVIEWTILNVNQSLPMPVILNNKATPTSGGKYDLTATLNCDSGSAITSQDGSTIFGVASIGNVASGSCAVTFAGIFSATPRCQANALGTTKDVRCQLNPTSSTAATLYITKPSDGTDLTAADCDVFCSGNK